MHSEKVCTTCNILKPLEAYFKRESLPDGHWNQCKLCVGKRTAEYQKQHPEKRRIYGRKYYITHLAQIKISAHNNWLSHDPEYHRIRRQSWRAKNPEKHHEWHRNWYKMVRSVEPTYKIEDAMRTRINKAIRGRKTESTFKLIGCTTDDLKAYIESLFKDGMSWDNYGEWHIDHIIPCAAFDLSKPEEQKCCFHYTNLQPLWAQDNRSKGVKLNWQSN